MQCHLLCGDISGMLSDAEMKTIGEFVEKVSQMEIKQVLIDYAGLIHDRINITNC